MNHPMQPEPWTSVRRMNPETKQQEFFSWGDSAWAPDTQRPLLFNDYNSTLVSYEDTWCDPIAE